MGRTTFTCRYIPSNINKCCITDSDEDRVNDIRNGIRFWKYLIYLDAGAILKHCERNVMQYRTCSTQ